MINPLSVATAQTFLSPQTTTQELVSLTVQQEQGVRESVKADNADKRREQQDAANLSTSTRVMITSGNEAVRVSSTTGESASSTGLSRKQAIALYRSVANML